MEAIELRFVRRKSGLGLALGLAALLPSCLAGSESGTTAASVGSFHAPLVLEERAGLAVAATPVSLGVPLPKGQMSDAARLELRQGKEVIAAESRVLARWSDGSVRWLGVDLLAPPLEPNERFEATLQPRESALLPSGKLEVSGGKGTQPLMVDTGRYVLETVRGGSELFRIRNAPSGNFSAPATTEIETAEGVFVPDTLSPARFKIEEQNSLATTLVRKEHLLDTQGRRFLRLTTRLTAYRGSPALKIQQSLDALMGVHPMERWDIVLPMQAPGGSARIATSQTSEITLNGDFNMRQDSAASYRQSGVLKSGRLPGVFAVDGALLAPDAFWQLFPGSFGRAGDSVYFSLCQPVGGERVVLSSGIGRTFTTWLWIGPDADALSTTDMAARRARPLRGRCTPEWYKESGALGNLGLVEAGQFDLWEQYFGESLDRVADERENFAEDTYGIKNFGDYYEISSLSYAGSLGLEYDPAVPAIWHFVRTGNELSLDRALEMAWHYADVDTTDYGGCFQHRATMRSVDGWSTEIMTPGAAAIVQADPRYDGTIASVWTIYRGTRGEPFVAKLQDYLAPYEERGLKGTDLEWMIYRLDAANEVSKITADVGSKATMRDYADAIAADPRAQALGFTNAGTQFVPFFDVYGGSWNDYPNFHSDLFPIETTRHTTSHSLVQGVLFAHLLTAEPRLGERALAFAGHHGTLVDDAIIRLLLERDTTTNHLYTRTVAWPLLNLLSVCQLTEGMPEHRELHEEILEICDYAAQTLRGMPIERIESSIHAGITLEALTEYHKLNRDAATRSYLTKLAQDWARDQYDWNAHAFRYKAHGTTEANRSMSALVLYGLAYAETLKHDPTLHDVIIDAWENLPARTVSAKALGMLYRSTPKAIPYIRQILAASGP